MSYSVLANYCSLENKSNDQLYFKTYEETSRNIRNLELDLVYKARLTSYSVSCFPRNLWTNDIIKIQNKIRTNPAMFESICNFLKYIPKKWIQEN